MMQKALRAGIGGLTALMALAGPFDGSKGARAQPAGCLLVPTGGQRGLRTLQCGNVTIVSEKGAAVEIGAGKGSAAPEVTVTRGGVLFEVRPEGDRTGFQIRTPHAIIAVRGTTWAVDVQSAKTEVFVIAGSVLVEGTSGQGRVVLAAGEGADVVGAEPLRSGPWPSERSRALLSRLGR